MKKLPLLLALLGTLSLQAQTAKELKQVSLRNWGIGTAQFSGITPLDSSRYAVVSDKEPADGFFLFHIAQDPADGTVTDVRLEGFKGNAHPRVDAEGICTRDCEGVAYFPPARTIFISGEGDQEILEYDMDGQPTGRKLEIPEQFRTENIVPNYGFEALTYDTLRHTFWTITESTLRSDGEAASPAHPGVQNLLRLQSFGDDLQPGAQYAYRMDRGVTEKYGKIYVFGVPCITPLPDGRLLVLEREANIPNGYLGSVCHCKLFLVNPHAARPIAPSIPLKELDPNRFMEKRLLAAWSTKIDLTKMNFANYEALCPGIRLNDGRQTLLLLNDSQGGYSKGPFHLKDYIKVILIGE
ncbi:MAG: esterase-like activity of phytase family protein [Alloprevotella sp.]